MTDESVRHVYEYAHGGTSRIKTLYDNYVDFNPIDCTVDPTTSNVAVASADAPYVVIFPGGKQNPMAISDAYAILFWCAYDSRGNLYVDKVNHRHKQYIGVLPSGSTTFKNYLLDTRAGGAGGLQFDGQHIVVDDLGTNTLHQLRFSGSNASVIGSTPLGGAKDIFQYWIHKRRVIGPDIYGTAYFWKYPGGGYPVKSIQGFTLPVGSTVSVSPQTRSEAGMLLSGHSSSSLTRGPTKWGT